MTSGDVDPASGYVSVVEFNGLQCQLAAALARLSVVESRVTQRHSTDLPGGIPGSSGGWPSHFGKLDVVMYDLETTGLGKTKDIAMTQIGAVKMRNNGDGWSIVSTWQQYVMPWKSLSTGAESVSGLSHKKLEQLKARPVADVLPEFNAFIEDDNTLQAVLIGHNAQKYDSRILYYELERSNVSLSQSVMYFGDTLAMFPHMWPSHMLRTLRLGDIYQKLFPDETKYRQQHDALADAQDTAKIFSKLWSELDARGGGDMNDISKMMRTRGGAQKLKLLETTSQWQARVGR